MLWPLADLRREDELEQLETEQRRYEQAQERLAQEALYPKFGRECFAVPVDPPVRDTAA